MHGKKLNIQSIADAMSNLGLNQSQLAKKLDVSRESVSQWLKGRKYPQPRLLLLLSKRLNLNFDKLVIKPQQNQPVIAFRTNKKKQLNENEKKEGEYMGQSLRMLLPYLNLDTVFTPAIIKNPRIDYTFIQKVVSELRSEKNENDEELHFGYIMDLYSEFRIVFIPVLWGPNGNNGLYINLPDKSITFVYANLEKVITDFKFWLLHELAHAMTPSLFKHTNKYLADDFADNFAGAMLFPEYMSEKYYNNLGKIKNTGILIKQIKAIARSLLISPFTVLKELNKYANSKELEEININIGGAVTNFNKQIKNVSEILFEESVPDAGRYIKKCIETFKTPFFNALQKYLQNEDKGYGIVQSLLNIPVSDAKGVYNALLNEKNLT